MSEIETNIKIGDVVKLKSGNMGMTVCGIFDTNCHVIYESHTRLENYAGDVDEIFEANTLKNHLLDIRCLEKIVE